MGGQGPEEQETSLKGRALRALVVLPLGWGGHTPDLSQRAGFSAESPLVLPRVGMETALILALKTLAPSPSSALYETLNVPACLLSYKMGIT